MKTDDKERYDPHEVQLKALWEYAKIKGTEIQMVEKEMPYEYFADVVCTKALLEYGKKPGREILFPVWMEYKDLVSAGMASKWEIENNDDGKPIVSDFEETQNEN